MGRDDDEQRQFAEYFTARRDAVRRTAYLLCGDWHWADDLTQVAFTRLAASWRQVREPLALDAFVRTCLTRAYFSDLRRVWRRREHSAAEPPDRPTTDGDTDDSDRRLLFADALRRLPPRQRAVLIYRYYQGLDVAATADALGCTTGTVKSQTARALGNLRGVLGDLGAFDAASTQPPSLIRNAITTEVTP
jgi:RNA polymerase sigma-70 factor (sigma-E family)